eukprot:scaffold81484_cov31-Tisochrysis_lutea.AAC.4
MHNGLSPSKGAREAALGAVGAAGEELVAAAAASRNAAVHRDETQDSSPWAPSERTDRMVSCARDPARGDNDETSCSIRSRSKATSTARRSRMLPAGAALSKEARPAGAPSGADCVSSTITDVNALKFFIGCRGEIAGA